MIAPGYRGGRLFVDLWHREIVGVLPGEEPRPSLVAVKTYNPLVYLAMRSFARLAGAGCTRPWERAARTRTWSGWPRRPAH